MKFLITWQIHEGKLHDTLSLFSKMPPEDEAALMGSVKLVGRWHDLVRGTGAANTLYTRHGTVTNGPSSSMTTGRALWGHSWMDRERRPDP